MAKSTKSNVVENVVVQLVEAPKAEFVLSLDDASRIDQVLDTFLKADDYAFQADIGMEEAGKMMAVVMGTNPTYVEWEAKRSAWIRKYMSRKPNANEESAERAWQRLAKRMEKEAGLTKPAKGSAESKRKATKRDEEKKALQGMVDSQLEQLLAAYKAEDEFAKASKIKAELKRREQEANKGQLEEAKEMRQAIIAKLKPVTDLVLLGRIYDMLPDLPDAEV